MAETKINANQTNGLMKQYDTMPTADATMVNAIVQYTGTTSSSYTKGYFYKCVEQQNPGTATATKSSSAITSVSVNASRFMEKMAYYFPSHAISGENVFQWSSDSWCFKLLPENLDVNMMVEEGGTFLEGIKVLGVTYSPDYASFSDGDTITITYTPAPSTYLWESSPTGAGIVNTATGNNSLTISGNPSSYINSINIGSGSSATSAQAVVVGINSGAANGSVVVGNNTTSSSLGQVFIGQGISDSGGVQSSVAIGRWASFLNQGVHAGGGVAIGGSTQISAGNGVAIGDSVQIGGGLTESAVATGRSAVAEGLNTDSAIAIGPYAHASDGLAIGYHVAASASYAIQIGMSGTSASTITNSDANTFKVANQNGNFEIMSADGTIPEARLADTTSAQEGDTLTLNSSGNAVWTNPLQYVLGGLQTTDSSKVGYLQYYFEENNAVSAPAGGKWLVLDCLKVNTGNGLTYVFSADFTSPVGSIVAGGTQIAAARSGYTTRALLLKVA